MSTRACSATLVCCRVTIVLWKPPRGGPHRPDRELGALKIGFERIETAHYLHPWNIGTRTRMLRRTPRTV